MFCPKCGQQQVSDEVRFCSRCGFQLEAVKMLLVGDSSSVAIGATALQTSARDRRGNESPRRRGIKQGAMLMLSTMLMVPVVVFLAKLGLLQKEFIPLVAIMCTIGGFLRLVYALMFQSGAAAAAALHHLPSAGVPPSSPVGSAHERARALPSASRPAAAASSFGGHLFDTAELGQAVRQPPSITESETRLLDDQ